MVKCYLDPIRVTSLPEKIKQMQEKFQDIKEVIRNHNLEYRYYND